MCWNKQGYDSKGEAQAAMHLMFRKGRAKSVGKGMRASAFKCSLCGKWHWGRAPTMKQKYQDRKNDR